MPYRNNARFVSKEIESDGNYVEMYEYRNNNYWIYPDSETPVDLQHQFEQQFIDYYIEKNANISGSAKDYVVRVIKDGVNVTLDNINIIEFDTNRQSNVVVTLEGDNTVGTLSIFGESGSVTFKGTGSLTFKWTYSTPLKDYTNVTFGDGLEVIDNEDGTYTIKKK